MFYGEGKRGGCLRVKGELWNGELDRIHRRFCGRGAFLHCNMAFLCTVREVVSELRWLFNA